MRRVRRFAAIAGTVIAALLIIVALLLTFSWPRSALTSVALRFFLQQRGLHVARASIRLGHGVLDVANLDVKDGAGNDFFLARRIIVNFEPAGLIGRSNRRFGLRSVLLQRPVLRLIHLSDGTWNASSLSGGQAAAPTGGAPPARVAAPYRFTVRVESGEIQVIDPQAAVRFAQAFSVDGINGSLALNEGGVSQGSLQARLLSSQGTSAVQARLFENDSLSFARATATAHDVAIAPIVDAIVPSRFFALERGRVDVRVQAYALAYPAGAPSWHLSADAHLRAGRMRVIPLVVPLRDLNGPLHFQDGLLTTTQLRGSAAGTPLSARGALQLFGGVRFAVAVAQAGRLESQRRLFAFSRALPLSGPSALAVRIDGPVDDLRVSGAARVHASRYGPVKLNQLSASFFFNNSHFTLTAADTPLAGGRVWAKGDIDLGAQPAKLGLIAQVELPASQLPLIANIDPTGSAQSLATVTGSLSKPAGRGYAQLAGGQVRARSFFTADSDQLFLGPLLVQPQHGELTVAFRMDRSNRPAPAQTSFELFAEHLPVRLRAGRFALPDVPSFAVTLPAVSGNVDGSAFVDGARPLPAVAVAATADQLQVAGVDVQHVAVRAAGRAGHVTITELAAHDGSAQADAHGAAVLDGGLHVRAAALQGTASADLGRVGTVAPRARMSGSIRGRFFAMLDGAAWTVSAQARSGDARIAGIPVQSADATLGGSPSAANSVLANADLAGGQVAAIGSIPSVQSKGASGTRIAALADHVDLATLQQFGFPVEGGSAVAIASLGGSLRRPDVRGAAALSAAYRNIPVSGDLDLTYQDGTLQSNQSRVSVDNDLALLTGSIAGLQKGAPAQATLDLRAQLRHADLATLNRFTVGRAQLTGAADADVRIGGTPSQPRVKGSVATDTGTLRGVTFDGLHGSIAASSGHVRLDQGAVQLGSSRFHVSGELDPGRFAVHATSPHVDMADFNDFFGGADLLAGTGGFRVNFASSDAGGLNASGGLTLDDAALRDYTLGHIETHFSSAGGSLLATVLQKGPGGGATIAGQVAFSSYAHGMPNFASARYNVKANVTNVDVAEITPLLHEEDLGLSGTLDAAGTLQGTLRRPVAFARVSLHDGHLRRIVINNLSGFVQTDTSGVRLRELQIATKFVTGTGQGSYQFASRSLHANVNLDAADLSELATAFTLPVPARGQARADLALTGTLSKPRFQATLQGTHDTVAQLAFNDVTARFVYVPGELDIGDTQLGLASGGQLNVAGVLPIQLHPLGLGPKQRPVGLTITAKNVNLAELNTLTEPNLSLNGTLNAQASVSGNAGNPTVAGDARVRGGSVASRWETVPLTNASADLSLLHETITLRELSGQLGSGSVNVNGAAHIVPAVGLRSNAGLQFYTNLNLRDASIDVPGWLSGKVNGALSLTRTAVRPYLSGSVALNSATIPFSAIVALANGSSGALAAAQPQQNVPGVPPLKPGHTLAYAGRIFGQTSGLLTNLVPATPAPKGFSLPPVDLNVAVTAGKDVRVRGGSAIDLTAAGSILIAGSVTNPTLSGSFQAVRGQIGYFDTTFRVERGTVTFSPTEGLLPTLDATATTTIDGTDITLTLSGRVDNLTTDLQSNPPMSRDQIVALLLHAPQVASLTNGSQQAAQTALFQTAQSYFNAELMRNLLFPFESALAESLNLEQIALIFDPQGNLAVEVRTRFSSTVSALYRSSLSVPVTQAFGVSYRLRDYLALELLQSQPPSGQTSTIIDLRYGFQ